MRVAISDSGNHRRADPASSARNPKEPTDRGTFRGWWLDAEKLAGVEHVEGRLYHSCRRAFATDLKTRPLVDVPHLGGWKDPNTVVRVYQQADEQSMESALASRERVTPIAKAARER